MKAHQKSPIGFERIDEYLLQHYKKPKNLESYVYVSQILQAEGIKTAIEAHRRAMPRCMGTLYWQLNDCWPAVSWSSQDYYGRKKALGYWIRNEYAPVLISPVIEDEKVKVYVISDNLVSGKGDLTLELIDFSGKVLWSNLKSVEIPANSSRVVFEASVSEIIQQYDIREILLIATLKDHEQVVSENTLYFDLPKNLNLQLPNITSKFTQVPEGYKVELSTDKLVKNLSLRMPFKGELPENFFDLIPGKPRTFIYSTTTKFPDISKMVRMTSLVDSY
jgi:beta-mannosidase